METTSILLSTFILVCLPTLVTATSTPLLQECNATVENQTKFVKLKCDTEIKTVTLTKEFIRQVPLTGQKYTIGNSPYPLTEISIRMSSSEDTPCHLTLDEDSLTAAPNLTRLTINGLCFSDTYLSAYPDELKNAPKLAYVFLDGVPMILQLINGAGSLKHLKLDKSGDLNLTLKTFSGLKQLVELDVSSQKITISKSDAFQGLPHLEKIVFWNNSITSVPDGVFKKLTQLKYLNLGDNNITKLAKGTLRGLGALRNLYLDFNEIKTVEAGAFSELPNLEYLGLENNNISALSKGAFANNKKLKYIGIASNKLKKLTVEMIGGLTKLESLFAYNNTISQIEPGTLNNLVNLHTIDLTCNPLAALPNGLFKFGNKLRIVKLPKRLENVITQNDFIVQLEHLEFDC